MQVTTLKANSLEQLSALVPVAKKQNLLILAFAATNIDHAALYALLNNKKYTVVSASSAGQFIDGAALYQEITCMILDLPAGSFKIHRYDYSDDFFKAGEQLGRFAHSAYDVADTLLFINASVCADHEAILNGFKQGSEHQVGIFGGLASYQNAQEDNFIGIAGKVSQQSVGIVVFDRSKVALQGLVVGGWQPVGTYKTVTKAVGKKVYELDHRPVKDVYDEYFNLNNEESIFNYLEFPIQMIKADGSTVMRVVVSIDDE